MVDRPADDRYRPGSTSFSCEVSPALSCPPSSTFLSRSLAHLYLVYNPGRVRVSLHDRRKREVESGRDREEERLTRGTKGRGREGENY